MSGADNDLHKFGCKNDGRGGERTWDVGLE